MFHFLPKALAVVLSATSLTYADIYNVHIEANFTNLDRHIDPGTIYYGTFGADFNDKPSDLWGAYVWLHTRKESYNNIRPICYLSKYHNMPFQPNTTSYNFDFSLPAEFGPQGFVGVIEIREYTPGMSGNYTYEEDKNDQMMSDSWRFDKGNGSFTTAGLEPNGQISCDYYISNFAPSCKPRGTS